MDENVKQKLLLAREHYQKGEYDDAEYLLEQVVSAADGYADVFDMLGVIAHTRGDFTRAEKHFTRAIEINPNYTEARLNLMVTFNDLGRYDDARSLHADLRAKSETRAGDPFARGKIANMHAETSQAYRDAGMLPEAIIELERAVALGPKFADLRCRLAQLYRESNQPDLAIAQLEAAVEANPGYVDAHLQLAVLHLGAGRKEEALVALNRAMQVDPGNVRAAMYLRIAQRPTSSPPPPLS